MPSEKRIKKIGVPKASLTENKEETVEEPAEEKAEETAVEVEVKETPAVKKETVEEKIELPKKEVIPQPKKVDEVPKVRVRVIKSYENIFIGGKRYSGKAKETLEIPEEIAHVLRSDGSVI